MTDFRTFRNADPPLILELWNRCAATRGFGLLSGCDNLERLIFAKPYFDREGLILALEGDRLVGLCHAGFGCDDTNSKLDVTMGVICMLLVDPAFRKRGIGSELLKRGQNYLREHGSKTQYAGAIHPLNPFYLGLYGGSELPGVLESDPDASAFFLKRHYVVADSTLVFQRSLRELPNVEDTRVPLLRRSVKLLVEPWPKPRSWWQAATIDPMVTLRYELAERDRDVEIGHALVWEMETFGRAWGQPSVGIIDFEIQPERRRQGYGKLMMLTVLKHLQDQRITLVEVQTMERNVAATNLYENLGFTRIDTGHVYRLSAT